MAIVVPYSILTDLDRWSTNSCELQGIWIEKPDERHKSLTLINAYIHSSTCITGVNWDFLEEMEDELGDAIMIYGDFNARSCLWDQHDTNQQGCALKAALSDVHLTPVSTTDNGTSTSPPPPPPPPLLPPVPSPLQSQRKGTGRSEKQWFKLFSLFCPHTFCVCNTPEILHVTKFYTRCMFTNIGIMLFSSLVTASMKMCYCAKAATLYQCT